MNNIQSKISMKHSYAVVVSECRQPAPDTRNKAMHIFDAENVAATMQMKYACCFDALVVAKMKWMHNACIRLSGEHLRSVFFPFGFISFAPSSDCIRARQFQIVQLSVHMFFVVFAIFPAQKCEQMSRYSNSNNSKQTHKKALFLFFNFIWNTYSLFLEMAENNKHLKMLTSLKLRGTFEVLQGLEDENNGHGSKKLTQFFYFYPKSMCRPTIFSSFRFWIWSMLWVAMWFLVDMVLILIRF